MKITVTDLHKKRLDNQTIVMLTSYDYPTAIIEDLCGIDIQLVGDSVGTNVLGYSDVSEVTIDDMRHHLRAVSRGVKNSFILCDMPYKSFQSTEDALSTARQFMEDGADGIKIEGEGNVLEIIRHLTKGGTIPVCGHIGYKPQFDGPRARVQGKDSERAIKLCEAALALENAGAFMIVLELIPEKLAREITNLLQIPTIGIGAGRYCSGQVQVVNDILGLSNRTFRHAKEYASARGLYEQAVSSYAREVRNKAFPTQNNIAHIPDSSFSAVDTWLKNRSTFHDL
ncbi:MAG: 3-methyl-2-oxobutanoate hydroxymethyltransferase [Chitinivibrionales bacterium]|nr:3-methyl-2-oxobutanoate hydroxymethyltransferase [Chitinivibrionales bacterium]